MLPWGLFPRGLLFKLSDHISTYFTHLQGTVQTTRIYIPSEERCFSSIDSSQQHSIRIKLRWLSVIEFNAIPNDYRHIFLSPSFFSLFCVPNLFLSHLFLKAKLHHNGGTLLANLTMQTAMAFKAISNWNDQMSIQYYYPLIVIQDSPHWFDVPHNYWTAIYHAVHRKEQFKC